MSQPVQTMRRRQVCRLVKVTFRARMLSTINSAGLALLSSQDHKDPTRSKTGPMGPLSYSSDMVLHHVPLDVQDSRQESLLG